MKKKIMKIINSIPIADTHEHLLEEENRLITKDQVDFSMLFCEYLDSDLIVAGMPIEDIEILKDKNQQIDLKWKKLRPFWKKVQNTGYGLVIRETLQILFDEENINDSNWQKINNQLINQIQPGYYRKILFNKCNIDHCQVNALDQDLYRDTNMKDFFLMDLCISKLCSDFDVEIFNKILNKELSSIDNCIDVIDNTFNKYGNQSIAIKNQSAYRRNLDYKRWSIEEVENSFDHCKKNNWQVTKQELKPIEDFLFHYTVDKAEDYGLPYKMHTGYHSGYGTMPLHNIRHNAGDMSILCSEHPKANFVFMHITYPYQNEVLALAKHYPNAYIDMCWSWMVNPLAAKNFLKEFLVSVPSNKIFLFGGDVSLVELVPGHLEIAKKGIAQAISELISERWLSKNDIEELLYTLINQNAYDLFPITKLIK